MSQDKAASDARAKPLFSVVIPAYNRSGEVEPTLRSVAAQTFADFECVVVDDGSADADGLKAIIGSLEDARFRYVRRENGGASAARNTGVRAARGTYIAFLDSDDFFARAKLQRTVEALREHPNDAIYTQCFVDRGVGRMWVRPSRGIGESEDMGEYLFVHNEFVPTSSLVLPRRVALEFPFDETLTQVEDPELCFRLYRGGVRFRMIAEPLTVWNDQSTFNRLSAVRRTDAPFRCYEKLRPQLSSRAAHGFRVSILTYYRARHHPLQALRWLAAGWWSGVPGSVVMRQFLRGFLPGGMYRRLVNGIVAIRGILVVAVST